MVVKHRKKYFSSLRISCRSGLFLSWKTNLSLVCANHNINELDNMSLPFISSLFSLICNCTDIHIIIIIRVNLCRAHLVCTASGKIIFLFIKTFKKSQNVCILKKINYY